MESADADPVTAASAVPASCSVAAHATPDAEAATAAG